MFSLVSGIPRTFTTTLSRNVHSFNPKTITQKLAFKKLTVDPHPYVVLVGPAGTGKTLLACHAAARAYKNSVIDKVIITRPAVTVDEDHGFLPGTIDEKLDPWVRPITDAFSEIYGIETTNGMLRNKVIEVCPLAYMRGRTFKNSFIILDEAQNTTPSQMYMALTRLGENSKFAITGDISQSDIDVSGLEDLVTRVKADCEYISCIEFSAKDVQRHEAIVEIMDMYDDERH